MLKITEKSKYGESNHRRELVAKLPEHIVLYDVDANIAIGWRGAVTFNVYEFQNDELVEVDVFTTISRKILGKELNEMEASFWAVEKAEAYVADLETGARERYWEAM